MISIMVMIPTVNPVIPVMTVYSMIVWPEYTVITVPVTVIKPRSALVKRQRRSKETEPKSFPSVLMSAGKLSKVICRQKGLFFSIVDRTSETYEIGDASSKEAYENWLKNSIGSGYYYASTDTAGLKAAYDQIFSEIKQIHESSSVADWVANDPMPMSSNALVEFIGFYDHTPQLIFENLNGEYKEGGENTASFDTDKAEITWDLKKSGFVTTIEGETTFYSYQLKYRVRLENEKTGFVENAEYDTNDTTVLSYVDKEMLNGNLTISDPKKLEFPIPAVEGYLGELEFHKIDSYGHTVSGAEFTLSHDFITCAHCRGDGTNYVDIPSKTVVSDSEGIVRFSNIPSGHIYKLEETKNPRGICFPRRSISGDRSL